MCDGRISRVFVRYHLPCYSKVSDSTKAIQPSPRYSLQTIKNERDSMVSLAHSQIDRVAEQRLA
jgi:hypothetical protein